MTASKKIERRVRMLAFRLLAFVFLGGSGVMLILAVLLRHWSEAPLRSSASGSHLDGRAVWAVAVAGTVLALLGIASLCASLWVGRGLVGLGPGGQQFVASHAGDSRKLRARIVLVLGLMTLAFAIAVRLRGR